MTLTGYPAEVLPWASFFHLFSFSFSPKAHPKGGSAGKPSRAHEKAKKGHQFPNFGLFAPEKVGIGTLQAVQYPTRRCPTLRSPEAPPRGAALARGGRAGSILGHLCLRRLSSRESDRDERLGSAAPAAAGPGRGAVCVRAGGFGLCCLGRSRGSGCGVACAVLPATGVSPHTAAPPARQPSSAPLAADWTTLPRRASLHLASPHLTGLSRPSLSGGGTEGDGREGRGLCVWRGGREGGDRAPSAPLSAPPAP